MLAELFIATSLMLGIPDGLLSSMCYVESHHQTEVIKYGDGHGNSVGVCQIKLATAKELGFTGTEKDLLNPKKNIEFAGKYLKKCYTKYNNWSKAVTCYNKGHSSSHGGSEYLAKVFNRMVYKTKISLETKSE